MNNFIVTDLADGDSAQVSSLKEVQNVIQEFTAYAEQKGYAPEFTVMADITSWF